MISLNVYLTPKAGKQAELRKAIVDVWMPAMEKQPGYIRAALLTPVSDKDLEEVGGMKPDFVFELVALWRTEQERREWVARDIHQEVFPVVMENTENASYTIFEVDESWGM